MISQSKIQHAFHRALSTYNDAAVVQKESAKKLLQLLLGHELGLSQQRVFEFGSGTGFLTHDLNEQLNINELIVNDLIQACSKYIPVPNSAKQSVSFISGNIDEIDIPKKCDLVCSASCVQWSNDLPKLIDRITASLVSGGFLGISSYAAGHFKELASLQSQINSESYSGLNYWTDQVWRTQLKSCYDIEFIKIEETTLWFNSPRELLLHLRLTGVNGNAGQVWNQQSLSKFENKYRSKFEKNGLVPLSYRPIYVIARKKQLT